MGKKWFEKPSSRKGGRNPDRVYKKYIISIKLKASSLFCFNLQQLKLHIFKANKYLMVSAPSPGWHADHQLSLQVLGKDVDDVLLGSLLSVELAN